MSIYEQIGLANQIREYLASLAVEDEVVIHDTLEGETDIFECMDWLLKMIAEEKTKAEAIKSYITKLSVRVEAAERREERWRAFLTQAMEATGEKTVRRALGTITLSPKPRGLRVIDEASIPDDYFIVETVRKLDKKRLKTDLETQSVQGAELDNGGLVLRVRV